MYHFYADDSQLWKAANPKSKSDTTLALHTLELAIKSISNWMCANKLTLNEAKTEFLVIGSKANLSKVENKDISVGGEVIQNSPAARNLGVPIDEQLSLHYNIHQDTKILRYTPSCQDMPFSHT